MDVAPFLESFRDINQRVIKLVDSLSALSALSELEPIEHDEAQLLDGMLSILLENHDIERCSFFVLDEGRLRQPRGADWNDLLSQARRHERGGAESGAVFELGEGVIGQAAATGRLQHCPNCLTDERFVGKQTGVENASGSLICAPVTNGGETLGVLSVYHPRADHFNAHHERFVELYAGFAGQLLVNARHVRRLEGDIQRRTRQLEEALLKTEELKDRFQQLSVIDELTELHNRRFFFPEARASLARAEREGLAFSILILDLDHFKEVNDRCGHAAGDRILRQVAALLQRQTRDGDILARFGGEEFVLALPGSDREGAARFAERIRAAVREQLQSDERLGFPVTASVGVSGLGQVPPGEEPERLLERLLREADLALYQSKRGGRDRVSVYEPSHTPQP